MLNHIDNGLARRVTCAFGMPLPTEVHKNAGKTTISLYIEKYPKPSTIRTRTVAILGGPGTVTSDARAMYDYLAGEDAYVDHVGWTMYGELNVMQTFQTTSSVLYDALYVADNTKIRRFWSKMTTSLFPSAEPMTFLQATYRHGKPIAVSGSGVQMLHQMHLEIPASGVCEKGGVVVVSKGTCRED